MIDSLKEYINKEVFEPAIASQIDSESKKTLKKTRTYIGCLKKIGDIHNYFINVLKHGDEEEKDLYKTLKDNNLKTFEDISEEIARLYSSELYDVSEITDVKFDKFYKKIEICAIAKNFNQRAGIREITSGSSVEGIIAEIELKGERYPNEWIEDGRLLKYFPQTNKNGLTNISKKAISISNIPIYIFIQVEKDNETFYYFAGKFKNIKVFPNESKPYMILEKIDFSPVSAPRDDQFYRDFEDQVLKSSELTYGELKNKLEEWNSKPKEKFVLVKQRNRNPYVVDFVLRRAKGICERCNKKGPFISATKNVPFLEVHHLITLAEGGDDRESNAIALCPNCHRELHFGVNTRRERIALALKIITKPM